MFLFFEGNHIHGEKPKRHSPIIFKIRSGVYFITHIQPFRLNSKMCSTWEETSYLPRKTPIRKAKTINRI